MKKLRTSYVDPARAGQDPGDWARRKAAPSHAAE